VRGVVLPGITVFTIDDARRAGRLLLAGGAVRAKEVGGVGGSGQTVVHNLAELDALLSTLDAAQLQREGLVLERNLGQVSTQSVGQVQVGPWLASYVGTQALTRDRAGHEVYGGSQLRVVRGGFESLLKLPLAPGTRTAVEQAVVYHDAAFASFSGLFASRCNYDVAQGVDDSGRWRSGVLEQSWRIGGASGAEVAALHALQADPSLPWADAATHEVHADDPVIPEGAQITFDGVHSQGGRLVKYVMVRRDADL
jgi:hypothetical protein